MTVAEKALRKIIRESVRDAIHEERLGLYEILVPAVSTKEMKEIERKYGSPSRCKRSEFKDMTDWVIK
ncbi:MAG: hypothetical protein M1147_05035 [Nitrospirae bacterium]|nr:hypothetical protein [Nitrospirota bacterium]MCL5977483.1 hypothetical protein [Nitrospirota bacterium]